jgi:hypothetical protein
MMRAAWRMSVSGPTVTTPQVITSRTARIFTAFGVWPSSSWMGVEDDLPEVPVGHDPDQATRLVEHGQVAELPGPHELPGDADRGVPQDRHRRPGHPFAHPDRLWPVEPLPLLPRSGDPLGSACPDITGDRALRVLHDRLLRARLRSLARI